MKRPVERRRLGRGVAAQEQHVGTQVGPPRALVELDRRLGVGHDRQLDLGAVAVGGVRVHGGRDEQVGEVAGMGQGEAVQAVAADLLEEHDLLDHVGVPEVLAGCGRAGDRQHGRGALAQGQGREHVVAHAEVDGDVAGRAGGVGGGAGLGRVDDAARDRLRNAVRRTASRSDAATVSSTGETTTPRSGTSTESSSSVRISRAMDRGGGDGHPRAPASRGPPPSRPRAQPFAASRTRDPVSRIEPQWS